MKRDFTATRPNEKWVADFTYCSTWSGVVYVAFITDVFSRLLIGWKASWSMKAVLAVDALNMAAWVRRGVDIDGVICHSDAGLALRPITACLRRPELAFPATGRLHLVAVDARTPSTLVPSGARSSAG